MEYFNKLLLQSCIFRMVLILFWAIIFIVWGLYHSSFSTMTNKREIYSKSYDSHFSLPFQTFIQLGPQFSEERKQAVYNSDVAEYEGKVAKMNIGKDQTLSPTENATSLEKDHSTNIGDEMHHLKFSEYSEGAINEKSAPLNNQPISSVQPSLFKNLINDTHMPKETLLRNSNVSELVTETLSPPKEAYNSKSKMPTLLKMEVFLKDKIKQLFSTMKNVYNSWFKKTPEES